MPEPRTPMEPVQKLLLWSLVVLTWAFTALIVFRLLSDLR